MLLSASNTASEKSLIILLDILGLVSRNPEVIASVNREMVVRFQSDYLASIPRIWIHHPVALNRPVSSE
jgi:hypothetical protein